MSSLEAPPARRRPAARAVAAGCVLAALWLTVGAVAPVGAAELAPGAQARIAAATFEVVQLKPEPDRLSYEKPLPLELLPYRERTDKYRSVGTAFAIAHGRFVSAAHVIGIGAGSQFGPPALRDGSGKVYPIDTILKYSSFEDYAVFTVRDGPAIAPLETRPRPPLNEPVFAVGNALGEGVVIRDGLYTSDSPEELEARWNWMRFSAAASPGNSGGPLVDRAGRVLGVVLRKSQSENLNFAVAIDQVLHGSEQFALFEARSTYRLAIMRAADSSAVHEQIPLPKKAADFYAAMLTMVADSVVKQHAAFLSHHTDAIFPAGKASLPLLHSVYVAYFPRLIVEGDSGSWGAPEPQTHSVPLSGNGSLEFGTGTADGLVRLRVPDGVSVASIFDDSRLFMDLVLKGKRLDRAVGPDAVRVTSLGKAHVEYWHTDVYDRPWQLRSWNVPFNDTVVIALAMPTPDGCVFLFGTSPSQFQEIVHAQMQFLTGFVYVSLSGKLQQWRDYLAHAALQPRAVRDLDVQIDYARGLAIRSKRFAVAIPAALQRIGADSRLLLKYSILPDGKRAVWDLAGVSLADGDQAANSLEVLRHPQLPSSLGDEFVVPWRTMTSYWHPYNSTVYNVNGDSRIESAINVGPAISLKSNAVYTLTVAMAGDQSQKVMKAALDTLQRGVTITDP